jgi:hypothetical protein
MSWKPLVRTMFIDLVLFTGTVSSKVHRGLIPRGRDALLDAEEDLGPPRREPLDAIKVEHGVGKVVGPAPHQP